MSLGIGCPSESDDDASIASPSLANRTGSIRCSDRLWCSQSIPAGCTEQAHARLRRAARRGPGSGRSEGAHPEQVRTVRGKPHIKALVDHPRAIAHIDCFIEHIGQFIARALAEPVADGEPAL